jgi:hypothetical protein
MPFRILRARGKLFHDVRLPMLAARANQKELRSLVEKARWHARQSWVQQTGMRRP